ncbi:MAG: mechanosensitive ion channel [Bacteroidales bacterium]|nr:mechanosensitive ion channel [Bacteroidales bacterium]
MDQILDFSNRALYTVITIAVSLFFVFRLMSWLLPILLLRKGTRKYAWRYTSLFELVAWLIFLIWAVNFLSESSLIYAIGLFVILFFFTFYTAWIALKDFVAGAFLKTINHFKVNETLRIGDYSGKIIKFTPSAIILETESGESIFLPYSYLFGKVIIKSNPAETILSHTFRIEIPGTRNLSITIDEIYKEVLNMPWSSLKKDPQIKPIMETATGHLLELTIFSIEKEYFLEMENLIKGKFQAKTIPEG